MKKLCLVFWLLPAVLCAQGAAGPQSAPDPKDACSIEGRVIDAITGAPLRNTALSLAPAPAPGTAQSTLIGSGATSDAEGKFAMKGIGPGTYRLTATRAGYLQSQYGARGPGKQGTPLTLVARQSMTAVEMRMTRGGVITGKVLDDLGDPVERASVAALRYRFMGNERQLAQTGSASTDDQGNYRMFGLDPDRYYLRVTPSSPNLSSINQSGAPTPLTYIPVYYPNTAEESAAAQIEMGAGSEMAGVNFALTRSRTYRITGDVQDTTGAGGSIMALLRSRKGPVMLGGTRFVTLNAKQTKLDVQGVLPGSYVLVAAGSDQGRSYNGQVEIDVTDRDISGVSIPLQAGSEIAGEVRVEDEAQIDLTALQVSANGMSTISLMTAAAGGPSSFTFGTRAQAKVAEDGKFTLTNVFADANRLSVTGLPAGFYVKAMQMGDQDVLESAPDFANAQGSGLRITVSGKAGTATGTVTDAGDKPVGGATVVLIPKSEKRRSNSQFYKTATTDQKGLFTIKSIDPGDYKAYAWEDVETQAWMDPEFVKPVESKGTAVTVDPSGQHQLQLKAITAEK
jgi:protocatechuate 3,4-dioxygenase beta subunit